MSRAIDQSLSQETSKNEPDFSYLSNLRSAFTIMHLLITCIRTMIIPLASSNISIRREIEASTTLAMNRMEEKVNSIVQKSIDSTLAWVSKLLASQKKNDFRPRDEGPGASSPWLEMLQTPVRFFLAFPINTNVETE
jgi:exocyst complex component 5